MHTDVAEMFFHVTGRGRNFGIYEWLPAFIISL